MQTEIHDIAVVGAGVIGALTAYIAKRAHPEFRITLLDRDLIGMGASAYGGAIRIPLGLTENHRALVRRSEELFAVFSRDSVVPPIQSKTIYWFVKEHCTKQFLEKLTDPLVRSATADEIADLSNVIPGLVPPAGAVPFVSFTAATGNAGALARWAVSVLRKEPGFSGNECAAVVNVEDQRNRFKVQLSDGRNIFARYVVWSTGPWLDDPLPWPEGAIPTRRIKKVAALHLDFQAKDTDPIVFFHDDDAYFLPNPERNAWIYCFASPVWDVNPADKPFALGSDDLTLALTLLDHHAPGLSGKWMGARVFCDAYAPERLPFSQTHPVSPNFVLATCGSGSGYRLGPAIAEQALSLLGLIKNK